jgi:hypothetical protein
VQHLAQEGRKRFAEALKSVDAIARAPIPEPGNTANMRLMVAYLEVCRCVREHFADAQVHADFESWVAELRQRGNGRTASGTIGELTRLECLDYAERLGQLARRVLVP